MEVCCSFKSLVGGVCGSLRKDRSDNAEVVPLLSCTKDITDHLSRCKFYGPENEVDLILCRAGLFTVPKNVQTMTICPSHRSNLGVGWSRGASTRCRIPLAVSGHSVGTAKRPKLPKGDRGVTKQISKMLLKETGIFIQVGSGKIYALSLQTTGGPPWLFSFEYFLETFSLRFLS